MVMRMIDGNKLGDVGFQKLGTPYSVMDCQKFYEWCLAQCGWDIDLGGSNSWYRYILEHGTIMTPEECVRQLGCVPKGATLFIHSFDGKEPEKFRKDGLGNASHMGICTIPRGKGAINSSYTNDCVCESTFKQRSINGGWNKVGLLPNVCYDYGGGSAHPDPIPAPDPEPLPEPDIATVWADNGKPVRLRKKKSTLSTRLAEVPCGDTVEVLDFDEEWSKVRWQGKTGYMMSKYLVFEEDDLYTVKISGLTLAEVKSLQANFADVEIV